MVEGQKKGIRSAAIKMNTCDNVEIGNVLLLLLLFKVSTHVHVSTDGMVNAAGMSLRAH